MLLALRRADLEFAAIARTIGRGQCHADHGVAVVVRRGLRDGGRDFGRVVLQPGFNAF